MGQTARLRLIRDQFIAGHSGRHLDSVPPETPIRDVVDRCRVWETHADPAVRRVCKPSPEQTYPANVVGDADSISETTRVAAVNRPRPGPDQLEDLLRRLLIFCLMDVEQQVDDVRLDADHQKLDYGTDGSVTVDP